MGIKARLAAAGVTSVLGLAGGLAYYFEGEINQTYLDPVGVLTACVGHTSPDLRLGQIYTDEQCTQFFIADLRHAEKVVNRCTPGLPEGMKPALVSFVFNVGSGNYCTSTLAKLAKRGEYIASCKELYKWVYAGKRVLPGLVTRRAVEARACLEGVPRD
jgi:lysozyme